MFKHNIKKYPQLASKRSERDTIRDNSIENWGYLLFGHTHVILYFDPRVFVFARRLILSLYATKQNPLIFRSVSCFLYTSN